MKRRRRDKRWMTPLKRWTQVYRARFTKKMDLSNMSLETLPADVLLITGTLSLSLTHTLSLSLSFSLSLSLSHTHSLSLSHTLHTHSLSLSHTHTHVLLITGTRKPMPKTRNRELGTSNPIRETQDPPRRSCSHHQSPKLGTRNPDPGTRTPKPGSGNREPDLRNPEPGSRDTKAGTRIPDPGPENSKLTGFTRSPKPNI